MAYAKRSNTAGFPESSSHPTGRNTDLGKHCRDLQTATFWNNCLNRRGEVLPLKLVKSQSMKQDWFCDLCLNHGTVEVDDRASVLTILYALEDAHRHAKPVCHKNNNLHHV